ncbi:MAG: polysaccharide biosynthesis/export family protein [Pseudomonadales bacterium]|jgi:polysaccharide export outer membrane protein|nr:polysaccharide biosynthesis/export family protein [Pseudomonadales bacterium]MDP6473023.1 polysaccharide biosynthesis/export family protein [Pseudomonadales bacterium]MDP6973321.1 polysaccharide biosynthesis/export family protein [Pseudomonadales bacterium]|tara:strand:+ start:697 stop:1317 length:621 start_codon:yes stop_codon:yes gene_type:complete
MDKSRRKVLTMGQVFPVAGLRNATGWILGMLLLTSSIGLSAAESTADGYRISPEDVLEISVWKEPDLQRKVVVRPDGGLSFPLAGDMRAAGLTPIELEANITEKLREYIPEAVVTVSVVEIKGLRIYVTGKVRSPGQYVVGRYVDVLQALTMAGGLTTFADANDIRVIRREGDVEAVYQFDYNEVENGENLSQNIVLHTDDVVVVP